MLQDQSGVSAVIGVIMMVAVTVVMAGIVGAFVFGVGSDLNQPVPQTQVNFVFDGDTGDVYIYHDGGEILTDGNTGRLTISGDLDSNDGTWGLGYNDGVKEESPSTEIGDKIWETTTPLSSGDEIVLSWESNNGKKSSKLGTFEAP
jgi:Uncharacterized protein conserved in archaea